MKVLINIPEEYYNEMKNTSVWWSGLKECVLNGKPLDDVLDKIRAEIEETCINLTYQENKDRQASWGLRKALEIIDKNMAESEGK